MRKWNFGFRKDTLSLQEGTLWVLKGVILLSLPKCGGMASVPQVPKSLDGLIRDTLQSGLLYGSCSKIVPHGKRGSNTKAY